MNRTAITYLITALLLLMNIQAAMGEVSEVFHQDMHLEKVLTTDTDAHMDDEGEDTHCQHCCHTHTYTHASHVFGYESVDHLSFSLDTHFYHLVGKSGPASGPPTPPPNV